MIALLHAHALTRAVALSLWVVAAGERFQIKFDMRDNEGKTPTMFAADRTDSDVVQYLKAIERAVGHMNRAPMHTPGKNSPAVWCRSPHLKMEHLPQFTLLVEQRTEQQLMILESRAERAK